MPATPHHLDDLVPRPWNLDQFILAVAQRTGRHLTLEPAPLDGAARISTGDTDLIIYDQAAGPDQQLIAIGHEIAHLLLGHRPREHPTPFTHLNPGSRRRRRRRLPRLRTGRRTRSTRLRAPAAVRRRDRDPRSRTQATWPARWRITSATTPLKRADSGYPNYRFGAVLTTGSLRTVANPRIGRRARIRRNEGQPLFGLWFRA